MIFKFIYIINMSLDTTNINELPGENITVDINEENVNNEFINGLQQASSSGALDLPSRDIPQSTEKLTHDQEIKENYIPQHEKYIENYESNEQIEKNINKKIMNEQKNDALFENTHMFLILGLLYFISLLPFTHKTMIHFFPFGFASDGNMNINGFICKSVVFTAVYYVLFYVLNII